MKLFITIIFAVVLLFRFSTIVSAKQFNQQYTITYVFDERGNASVTKQISLTNLNEDVYPSQYFLDIPEDAVNISAFDEAGKIELEIARLGDKKQAILHLNTQNIGISKKTEIALAYETRQLASKRDDWSVFIPPTSSSESVSDAIIKIDLPASWGKPTSIIPQPIEPFTWAEDHVPNGINIIYGKTSESVKPSQSNKIEPSETVQSYKPFLGLVIGLLIVAIGFSLAKIL